MHADGAKWLQDHKGIYDVIIVDSSDPIGPASTLFEESFYQNMKEALAEGGIICTQGECQWLHADLITDMQVFCSKMFKNTRYGYTTIPTYPSGQIGFIVCSDVAPIVQPVRELPREVSDGLNYYSPEIHQAAFVLPKFMQRKLQAAGLNA